MVSSHIEEKSDVTSIVQDLWDTLKDNKNGVGLAAPQIGINKRAFVVNDGHSLKKTFINPIITERFGDVVDEAEGCLSIPGLAGRVARLENIIIEYFDENWMKSTTTYSGMQARIIQHEYDHLEGVLWVDHLPAQVRMEIKPYLDRIKYA
jgi:peptide deformylase